MKGGRANGWVFVRGYVDDRHVNSAAFKPRRNSMPDPSFRLISRMMQVAFSKSPWSLKASADENRTLSYPCVPKHPRNTPQHRGVIIDDKYAFFIGQDKVLDRSERFGAVTGDMTRFRPLTIRANRGTVIVHSKAE